MTERVTIGRIVKPHGIRGEVVVLVLTDVPDRFAPGTEVELDGRSVTVASSRAHQGRLLVRFEGVTDRSAAELLRGGELRGEPTDPDELDTYLVSELVGAHVEAADGASLGTVSALIELPPAAGYDLLEVTRDDGRTWLLPAADELVEAVEDEDGLRLVLVDAPEGLVDLGEDAAHERGSGTGEDTGAGTAEPAGEVDA
jgi:16S rRNA processing protein RimM